MPNQLPEVLHPEPTASRSIADACSASLFCRGPGPVRLPLASGSRVRPTDKAASAIADLLLSGSGVDVKQKRPEFARRQAALDAGIVPVMMRGRVFDRIRWSPSES